MDQKTDISTADVGKASGPRRKAGPTVLIIDDSADNVRTLRDYLEAYGASVAVCARAAEALSHSERLQPDLILLGGELRDGDSLALCRRLKDSTTTYGIPVIFVCGRDEPEARVRGLRAGAVDYMTAPLHRAELLERIRIHWRGRRMHRKLKRKVRELRSARDTLESRVAERTAALQDSLEKLRDLYHNAPCGYHSLDPDGIIVQINETELNWLGYTEAEVVGRMRFIDIVAPLDRKAWTDNFQVLKQRRALRDVEYNLVRKDGSQLPVLLNATAVTDEDGNFVMSRATTFDISARREAEDRVRYVAHHDVLTGLLNRIAFKLAGERRLRVLAREGREAAVLFIDLDNFKTINDSLGHYFGDKVIVEAARRIRRCVEAVDIVARFGGDEFVMLLRVGEAGAQAAARRLLAALSQPFNIDGHELHGGATIGISLYPRDGGDLDALMRAADAAMYAGKRRQRGCAELFAPALADDAALRLAIASQIPLALDRKQFFIEYQPQFELNSGRVVGIEALIRWQHPVLGRLGPDQFIPIAEESGIIHAIGEWVLRDSCEVLKEVELAGYPGISMAVNVSVRQFQSPQFDRMVAETVRAAGVRPASVELEITESLFLEHAEDHLRMLQRVAAGGVTLAVDDFGVGYCGLGYLQRLPLHKLKIDRSFISSIGEPTPTIGEMPLPGVQRQPMAAAIISMARTLNFDVVAEGVEGRSHVDFLRAHGCTIAQGYYLARPVTKAGLIELLSRGNAAPLPRRGRG